MNSAMNCNWVALKLEDEVRLHYQCYKPREIVLAVWDKWATNISYFTAWKARTKIMELIHGNYEDSYRVAPALCLQMLKRNPGSIAQCHRHQLDEKFTDLCIAFNATLEGWVAGCRPVIGLDGCHLKGKYGGCLLSITALDGNNGLYPLAIYICRSEGYHSWFDFLSIMEEKLKAHPQVLTIISDQQKGLQTVIGQIFPHAYTRFCFR
ncbi:hypothetical protein ACHQM5_021682 [Ranunculus cassubicifolius]